MNMVAFQLPGYSQQDAAGTSSYAAAPGMMEDGFEGRMPPKQARHRCASAPARRALSAKPRPVPHASPLAVKGRALQHNHDGEAAGFGVGPARAVPMPPRQSSPGPVYGLGARPKRRTEGRGRDVAAADILAHPALPRIRTHVDGGLPGKRHLPGSREELSALFRAYNLPMPRALPLPPCRASTAGGHAAARPVSGLPAKGAQARPTPAAHPYHQRLRGLLDASSCASHVAPPAPGRLAPLNHDQQRGVSAHQRPPKPQAVPSGLAAAAVAVPKPGRQSGVAVEPLPLPIVLGRPLEVNHGRAAVLPGGGGQAASRASQGGAAAPDQMAQAEEGAADEHEQWDWVYRGPPTPESPYGSDILRAMLNVISPRFEVRRPDGYIPITPSSITSSRYARSDVWSWSCPGSPAPGLRPAPDGSTDASAAAAGGGGGGDACGTGRSPFTAARPSPAAGPTPRHSSPEPLHRKLLLRAAAAAAAAAGDAPQLSRQGSRQGSATAAPLQAAALHDRGCSLTPPGGLGWNLSMRVRAEHHHDHVIPQWAAAGRTSQDSHDLATTQGPPRHPPESHVHRPVLAAPHLAPQQQHQRQSVGCSPGPTPPNGKSRFYQQQQQHQPPRPQEHALPQLTPRQQVGTVAAQRRVSEGGLPSAACDWQPTAGALSSRGGATPPVRELCTPPAALQLPHLPQRGSSAGRFTRAAAMGLHADGGHPHQLAFVVPSLAGAGSRPACTPSGCRDLLWEPPPIQPSRALDRPRSGSRTPSPECTIRGESRERVRNLADAAAERLQHAAAGPRSRRPSSSPSPLPAVFQTGSRADAERASAGLHQQCSSSPGCVAVSARRVLYRPDADRPSPSIGPAPRSASACRPGSSAAQGSSILESGVAVRACSSPAARAAAAALARATRAQIAIAESTGTANSAAAGAALLPPPLKDMHGVDTFASNSVPASPLLPSSLPPGSAFSFHMGPAATGAVEATDAVDSWRGAATPALCRAAARPASRQSRQGRRQWALSANSAPSSPRVQLFPVPADDGSSIDVGPRVPSSPSLARCGSGIHTPGTPGGHRKRYGGHGSIRRAGLRVMRERVAAAAAAPAACLHAAQTHDASSSPFITPRELSSDAAAPGSGSDCGGAPSSGAMMGSSVDSWGTCLVVALPPSAQQGSTSLPTEGANGLDKLQQQPQPQVAEMSRARAVMPSRFGPLSPAAALAQRSRCASPVVRPGMRGYSPAAGSPFMGEVNPPMSPLRHVQPSTRTASSLAAADGVRRNLLSSFRSASAGRPSSSPEPGTPSSSSGIPPRCPAPRPASSGQPLASSLCPAPPQPMQRYPSAQQTRRRQWERPGCASSAESQDVQLLVPLPPPCPWGPSGPSVASPRRQAKHSDTRCDQDLEQQRPDLAGRLAAGLPPAGGFAPQPPLAPRDSLVPRRPSTSGSIRSSKGSLGAARDAGLAGSTDDDVAAGQVDSHTANAPYSTPAGDHRPVQHVLSQRSILDSPDLGPKKARPSSDGAYLTPAGFSSRPPSAASRCSSAGASDSSRGQHWSYRRARERAVFLNSVLAVAASSAADGDQVVQAARVGRC